jgi:restriction system protein
MPEDPDQKEKMPLGIPGVIKNTRLPGAQILAPITGTGMFVSGRSTLAGKGTVTDKIPDDELVIPIALVGFTGPAVEQQVIRSVTIPWVEILRAIQTDPGFLHTIHPKRLEQLVAEAYIREGYTDVELTPYSGDKGRDVIVTATLPGIGTVKIVDQIKRYAPHYKVKADDVRALAGVLLRDLDVSKGIVTTTSEFAPGAYKEYPSSKIELKNGEALVKWLNEVNTKSSN